MTGDVVQFTLNGNQVQAPAGGSLLDALRESLGVRSVKDGCSPQGQCGCCTVWIDGQPRVACVTQVGRVAGRDVTTIEGLPSAATWAASFVEHGGSQCGFCTPGILMRAAALDEHRRTRPDDVRRAMLAHLCRCTGWQTVVEAVAAVDAPHRSSVDPAASAVRAALEGGVPQAVGPDIALGGGGFADDRAPTDALVALRGADGEWVVGETLAEARAAERQGPRSPNHGAADLAARRSARATGSARCARPGSNRRTSNRMPRGAGPVASRRARTATVARSAASWRPRSGRGARGWPTSTAVRCA